MISVLVDYVGGVAQYTDATKITIDGVTVWEKTKQKTFGDLHKGDWFSINPGGMKYAKRRCYGSPDRWIGVNDECDAIDICDTFPVYPV